MCAWAIHNSAARALARQCRRGLQEWYIKPKIHATCLHFSFSLGSMYSTQHWWILLWSEGLWHILLSARDRSPLLAINLCWRALLVTRSMMDLYVFVLATGIWKWSSQKPCSSLHPVTAPRNAKTSKDQTHAFGTVLWMRMQCLGQNVSWIIPMWSVHACCVHIMWNHVGKGRSFHHTWKGSTVQGWCCVPYPLLRYIPESTSPS